MPTKMTNAKDVPLNQNSGTVPNMSDTIAGYLQAMTFDVLTKTVVDYQNVETTTPVDFQGTFQPFSDRQLLLKPEGQRSWSWFMVHSQIALPLKNDDVVKYLGIQYRVMSQKQYPLYGFYEYHIINDYTGSGPIEATP